MGSVSAIVPNFNHGRFLERRIRSVLEQTHADLEVILLDDASTDGSRAILESHARDPRVSAVIFSELNSGNPFHQWNVGARLARGDYLWFAESDDDAEPALIEVLTAKLDANPGAGLAYAASSGINEEGRPTDAVEQFYADVDPARWQHDFVNIGLDECRRYLCYKNTIPNASAVLVRRSAFEAAGGADESFAMCGDWLLWARILLASDVTYVAAPLNRFRTHSSAVRQLRRDRALVESLRVISFICDAAQVPQATRRDTVARFARYWLWLTRTGAVSWTAQREALGIARTLDPHIELRLLQAVPTATKRRLRRLAQRRARSGIP